MRLANRSINVVISGAVRNAIGIFRACLFAFVAAQVRGVN
jgi:hypothetical protein